MKIDLFKQLCMNYDKVPNEELYILWKNELKDFDPYYIEVAIKNIIARDRYFPTLSKILEELKNVPAMEIPQEVKIKRMKDKGVIPSWLNQNINESEIEVDYEFKNFIEGFRK